MANLTGLHGFFSSSSVKKSEGKLEKILSETDSIVPESIDSFKDKALEEVLVVPSEEISMHPSEQVTDVGLSNAGRLSQVAGGLNMILSAMTQSSEISNLVFKENEERGVDAQFTLGKCDKKAPQEAVNQLIRGVGNGRISENTIASAVKCLNIKAHFPEKISIETGFKMRDQGGVDNYIKFKDPKKAISLDFESRGNMLIGGLLSTLGLSGHVGVRQMTSVMDAEGNSSVNIIFDKYDEKGWRDKTVEVDLGEDQASAIAFWDLISKQADLGPAAK